MGGKEAFRWENNWWERSPNRCYYKQIDDFYGNAIQANSHNVNENRRAVWVVWAHTLSTDDEPKHWFCPKGKNSWFKCNVSVHHNRVNEISHKNTLAKAVFEVIKPVFKDFLSYLKLLRRFLGGESKCK
ncbi:uncharacterized protein TNCV_1529381 [Trichonephila clavipes]|uniref:Uncharacterized protein n=1 Tax=Trichonephila clavipes TaxID=2585209 RepID=A0A8X6SGG0_TRICX|nr:uncharacterized protein TNCV_1529381 [Trichonephila clavipes]